MSAVADKLREARALIERGWCQNADARGKSGRPVSKHGSKAVCWCAWGAIDRACGQDTERLYLLAPEMRHLFAMSTDGTISTWNDAPERTQSEVLAAFDKAIALAEQSDAA